MLEEQLKISTKTFNVISKCSKSNLKYKAKVWNSSLKVEKAPKNDNQNFSIYL